MGETLYDAFLGELNDTYDAENQLTKALPKMAKPATSPELRSALESHLEETRGQIARLEQAFQLIDEKAKKALRRHRRDHRRRKLSLEEDFDHATMDACLIAGSSLGCWVFPSA